MILLSLHVLDLFLLVVNQLFEFFNLSSQAVLDLITVVFQLVVPLDQVLHP